MYYFIYVSIILKVFFFANFAIPKVSNVVPNFKAYIFIYLRTSNTRDMHIIIKIRWYDYFTSV